MLGLIVVAPENRAPDAVNDSVTASNSAVLTVARPDTLRTLALGLDAGLDVRTVRVGGLRVVVPLHPRTAGVIAREAISVDGLTVLAPLSHGELVSCYPVVDDELHRALLQSLVETARAIFKAKAASIFLLDEDGAGQLLERTAPRIVAGDRAGADGPLFPRSRRRTQGIADRL